MVARHNRKYQKLNNFTILDHNPQRERDRDRGMRLASGKLQQTWWRRESTENERERER